MTQAVRFSDIPRRRSPCTITTGRCWCRTDNPAIPDFEPLSFFRTEVARNGSPPGIMVNSPAVVRGTFGKGRVLVSSPHPEQTPGLEAFAEKAIRWVTEKN